MDGLIVLAVWAVSGFLAYGLMLGYLTNLFPEFDNSRPALTFAVAGPITVLLALAYAWEGPKIHFRLRQAKES